MDNDDNNDNVFKFGAITGGKDDEDAKDAIPQNDYFVVDVDGVEYDVNGFLIFTPHHLAIMSDEGNGAIPSLVLPISRVKVAVLASIVPDDTDELPF